MKTKIDGNNITPRYVFSKKKIEDCYYSMCKKMEGVTIYYSLKANAEEEVLEILKNVNAKFEIASVGEFDILKKIGVSVDRIICGLPVKPASWLQNLYSAGCRYFIFDSKSELDKLINYAPDSLKVLRISVEDLVPNSIEYGMSYASACDLLTSYDTFIYVDGISFHISNNVKTEYFNCVMDRVESLIKLLKKPLKILNIGGGYRIDAQDEFYVNLQKRITQIKLKYDIEVIAEPGNTIVNSAGSIYTKVIGLKKQNEYIDVFIDVGKPSGLKTGGKRIPKSVNVVGKKNCPEKYKYRFVDITCMYKPHFFWELDYVLEENDIIQFTGMGAYSVCLQSKFHLWESPKIQIVP